MNKDFFIRYIYIINKWLIQVSKWYPYIQYNINVLSEKIIHFFYNTSEFFIYEKNHFVIIMIYFRRFLNYGFHDDPFIIFIMSFLFCIKFWEDNYYKNKDVIKNIHLFETTYKNVSKNNLNLRMLFNLELKIIMSNVSLYITQNTFKLYESLLISESIIT